MSIPSLSRRIRLANERVVKIQVRLPKSEHLRREEELDLGQKQKVEASSWGLRIGFDF